MSDTVGCERLFFKINNKQVVFKTDKRTIEKLNDEDVLMSYIKAIINSKMLMSNGQSLINYPVDITRTDNLDTSSLFIELEVSTIMQDDGVEELHCAVLNDGTSDKIKNPIEIKSVENQNIAEMNLWSDLDEADIAVNYTPVLKWSTEMTSALIALRGNLNDEFNSSKYKFKLWELIARQMNNGMSSVNVTAKDCDDKWRNIAATYRKNIEKIKSMGDFIVRWEHFGAMDKILKGTDEFKNSYSCIDLDKMNSDTNKTLDIASNNAEDNNEVSSIVLNPVSDDAMDFYFLTSIPNVNNDVRLWTQEMILLLLTLRRSMADSFDHAASESEKDLLWHHLVSKMNACLDENSDIKLHEAKLLWNQCVQNYELNLNKLKIGGPQNVKWPYFAIMDQMLGGTIEIPDACYPRPGEELVPVFMQGMWKQSDVQEILNNYRTDSNVKMDDYSDASDESEGETKCGVKWNSELTRKLIHLRADAEEDVKKWIRKPNSIWTVVLKKFRRLGIVFLTEQDLENKWNSLVKSYKLRVSGISKKGRARWPYFYSMENVMNIIGNKSICSITPTSDGSKFEQPPEWFLNYMKKKEATDSYKHEQLRNMLLDIQHSQMENKRLILSNFKKL